MPPSPDEVGFAAIPDGFTVEQTAPLHPGRWSVSLQYASPTAVSIDVGSAHLSLPPSLDRKGPFWLAGTVTANGRVRVTVGASRRHWLAARRLAAIGALAFTPEDVKASTVPSGKRVGATSTGT